MADFNMLSAVPYNVNVPEFQPERSAPVFPVVTRKYRCIEDVVTQDYARFNTLTWKIQQPDRSMVWQSVKLVLPLEMKSYRVDDLGADNMPHANAELDMRIPSKRPACNIAVAESPMGAFRQSSLTINGRIFSEVNDYRRVLDTCYRGTGPSSYGDNHSLKPVACRDLHSPNQQEYAVQYKRGDGQIAARRVTQAGQARPLFVRINDSNARSIDSAFSLLEHNGPFLERARKFQDELSFDGKTWTGLITNYLELGPFQARARVGNTSVPYVRDLHLRLNFDTNPSKFDATVGAEMTGLPLSSCRTIPAKLFEFGTIANLKHFGESVDNTNEFICGMKLRYTEKPYLEVQYVRYIEPMKSFYNLRCFEHQYEQSNPFPLLVPVGTRVSPTSTQRVTSRLLSYPTKVYLYGSLSDAEQNPYGLGNVRRSCLLKNIHCRVNQRPDIIFNPSQEECYQMFRRHTNSSLEYGSWLKSPIYVFDPVDLGQPDMMANDARLSLMEWDAEVSLTPLQIQEIGDLKNKEHLIAEGYNRGQFRVTQFPLADRGFEYSVEYDYLGPAMADYVPGEASYSFLLCAEQNETSKDIPWVDADSADIINEQYQFSNGAFGATPTTEIIQPTTVTRTLQLARGFIWARVDMATGAILGNQLYYVPRSHSFTAVGGHHDYINEWSAITTAPQAGPGVYHYTVNQATILVAPLTISGGTLDGRIMNGAVNFRVNGMTPGHAAFKTSRLGIENNNVAANVPGAGLNTVGNNFVAADQLTNAAHQWLMFRPNAAMVAGTGDDAPLLRWRRSRPARNQAAGAKSALDKGNWCLRVSGAVKRNVLLPIQQPAHPNLAVDGNLMMAMPLNLVHENTVDTHSLDYTLKALYEYGNCQYQFTADGQPTKVLPNLVPVRDSTAIPIV